jgi:hypothetical protein
VNTLDYTMTESIRRMSLIVELLINNGKVLPYDPANPVDEILYLEHSIARLAQQTAKQA